MPEVGLRSLRMWRRLVEEDPEAPAVLAPSGEALSRADLDAASDALAGAWDDAGMTKRGLLMLRLPNGIDWMVAFFASLKAGYVVVPLDPGVTVDRADELARKLRAAAIWDGNVLRHPVDRPVRRFRPGGPVLGKLTSGSTGEPRAFFFADSEMVADATQIVEGMGLRATDRNLGVIPWGHSYGLGNIVFPLLTRGIATCWTESAFPEDLAAAAERTEATVFPAVPTFLRILLKSGIGAERLRGLRRIISAGAPLSAKLSGEVNECFGLRPRNFYGSTETGGIAYNADGRDVLADGCVGSPLPGVRVSVGRGGRLRVQSPAVHRYGNRHAKDGPNAAFLCGDRGTLDGEGRLFLRSRTDRIVKIGGRRVSVIEASRRLEAVFGRERVTAFVLEVDGESVLAVAVETELPRAEAVRRIKAEVPLRCRPKRVRCVERFPLTARGKVDTAALKRLF